MRPPRLPVSGGRRALVLLLALPVLLLGLVAPVAHADELAEARARHRALQEAIARQRQALQQLHAAEADLRTALNRTGTALRGINADQAEARREIADATAALKRVEARYATLVAELRYLDWTLGILEDELAERQRDLDGRQRLLAQRLAEAYETQQTGLLQQILVADSFTSVLADVGDYLQFGEHDAQLAQEIKRDEAALGELRRATTVSRYRTDQVRMEVRRQAIAIREQRERLIAAKQRLDALERATRQIQAQQQSAFLRVAGSRAQAAATLRRQQAAENRLKADVGRLVAEQRRRAAAAAAAERRRALQERRAAQFETSGATDIAGTGRLRWPMEGYVSQEFGCTGFGWEPAVGGCAHFHRGIDIVAPAGTPVRSAGAGTVVFVGYNPYDDPSDPAWIVIVSHGGGLTTWYAHLQPTTPPGIAAGATVASGQVVGFEGNTGHSTGPHLHWAVLRDDEFVNPRLYV